MRIRANFHDDGSLVRRFTSPKSRWVRFRVSTVRVRLGSWLGLVRVWIRVRVSSIRVRVRVRFADRNSDFSD